MLKFGLSEGELAELLKVEPGMVRAWISDPGVITPVAHSNLLNLLISGVDAHQETLAFRRATQRGGEGAPASRAQIVIDLIEDADERGYPKWYVLYILEPSIGPMVTDADKSMWYGYKTGIGYAPPTDEMLASFYEEMADSISTEPSVGDHERVVDGDMGTPGEGGGGREGGGGA